MRKTQVALAALALVASTAALAADVTVSGVVDFGYQSLSNGIKGSYDSDGAWSQSGDTGRLSQITTGNFSPNFLIVSANEDLGSGLKANVTFQNLIDRSAFNPLGVKASLTSDSLGDLTVGNWLDPMFLVLAPHSAKTDGGSNIGGFVTPFFASNISGAWVQNQLAYTTPEISGVKATVFYRTGEETASTSLGSSEGVTASYSAGPLGVGVGYSKRRDATNPNAQPAATDGKTGTKATVAGASYDLGMAKVGAMYMSTNDTTADLKKNTWGLNVTVPVDAFTLTAGYYTTKVKDTDNKGTNMILTAMYSLSKRTSLFANVESVKNVGASGEAVYIPNAGYTNCGTNVGGCSATTAGYYDTGFMGRSTGVTMGVRHSF